MRFLRALPQPVQLQLMSLCTSVTLLLLLYHYSSRGVFQVTIRVFGRAWQVISRPFRPCSPQLSATSPRTKITAPTHPAMWLCMCTISWNGIRHRQLTRPSRQDPSSKFVEDHVEDAKTADSRKGHSKDKQHACAWSPAKAGLIWCSIRENVCM